MKTAKYFIVLFFVAISFTLSAKIRYVKVDGSGDGSSWENASASIQTIIDNSTAGDEIWVATGTYYPTTETIARDARSRTFLVKDGVNIRGGFAGTETLLSQRVLTDLDGNGKKDSCELANKTILSGDINGVTDEWTKKTNLDGTWLWTVTGTSGNCYRVVTGQGKNIIDGFTVFGGNANNSTINSGGGIYFNTGSSNYSSYVKNCTVSNCYATSHGGGIYSESSSSNNSNGSFYVTNCKVLDCSSDLGGGIYFYNFSSDFDGSGKNKNSSLTNCMVSNCYASKGGGIYFYNFSNTSFKVTNCIVYGCSAAEGGGIYIYSDYSTVHVRNCIVYDCSAMMYGGGIYSNSFVTNCTITNCSSMMYGGGIYSKYSSVTNCMITNCYATLYCAGIYSDYSSYLSNCAASNNKAGETIGVGSNAERNKSFISPDLTLAYVYPSSFIGIATTNAQKAELLTTDWHLTIGSPCINTGSNFNYEGKDLDNNPRIAYGTIDIGAYEYVMPTLNIPTKEEFDSINNWINSELFYSFAQINGGQIKWNISNQKAQFDWQTNFTTNYSQPIFTYQIDGTYSSEIYLLYDMYFQAYSGSISPLGTEKLNIEYSTDLITWTTIATYSNANGSIANRSYIHDLSPKLAGKKFFIRFNANGANSNRIEKWEIDNISIYGADFNAVKAVHEDKCKYTINNGVLSISNIDPTAQVQIFDINGKMLSNKENSQTTHFSLPFHGVYLVKVTYESGTEIKKIAW